MVFGLSGDSESEERTEDLLAEVCDKVGEKPRVLSCLKLGLMREGTCRPILVSLASVAVAQQLLYRAKELRHWDKYGRSSLDRGELAGKVWLRNSRNCGSMSRAEFCDKRRQCNIEIIMKYFTAMKYEVLYHSAGKRDRGSNHPAAARPP